MCQCENVEANEARVAFGIAVTQPRVEIDGHPADRSESECDEEEEHLRGVLAELGPPNPQSRPC